VSNVTFVEQFLKHGTDGVPITMFRYRQDLRYTLVNVDPERPSAMRLDSLAPLEIAKLPYRNLVHNHELVESFCHNVPELWYVDAGRPFPEEFVYIGRSPMHYEPSGKREDPVPWGMICHWVSSSASPLGLSHVRRHRHRHQTDTEITVFDESMSSCTFQG